ncbi:Dolichyl-diphosphooligosaccharide--protein glycosyltransferase subunit 2 [Nymphaea thermarum]|nr:Dolichyl-diphosphooligosaccharide--protein glycosyltransferase subunit 2 [Nymphaea thermarum]
MVTGIFVLSSSQNPGRAELPSSLFLFPESANPPEREGEKKKGGNYRHADGREDRPVAAHTFHMCLLGGCSVRSHFESPPIRGIGVVHAVRRWFLRREMYEALRTFQILGIEPNTETMQSSCHLLSESLDPSSAKIDELFYALKAKSIGHCQIGSAILEEIKLRLQSVVKDASSLSDYYYAVGGLVSIKEQSHENNNLLADASGVFRSIKSLSQSDGRWRYNSDGAESSTYAAGMAFSALAGVISLAGSEIEESMVPRCCLGTRQRLDDEVLYFDEKLVDATYNYGPLSTTSSVLRGVAAFTGVTSGKLNIPGEKILGLANFFLSIGIPGSGSDLYLQLDSLAVLDNNRISIPLILSLPASVLSLTSKDLLKVKVSRVFGSEAPPLTVTVVQAHNPLLKDSPAIQDKVMCPLFKPPIEFCSVCPYVT